MFNIKDCAIKYLAARPRTEKEVINHLKKKGFENEDIRRANEDLKSLHYIDDAEYAYMYIRYSFEKGRSIHRAKIELKNKGVSAEDTIKGIYLYEDEFDIDITQADEERARNVAAKFLDIADVYDKKTFDKLGRKLERMGYSYSVISQVLRDNR